MKVGKRARILGLFVFPIFRMVLTASKVNPPITADIIWSLEKCLFNFYIGNDKNPPIPDKNSRSLEVR